MITTKDLTKTFTSGDKTVNAVDHVSFSVDDGQFASIIGRSGSGKSTLLSLLGALERPSGGSITIGGKDITRLNDEASAHYRARTIGFVFQSYNLIPNLTAVENVMLPMEFARIPARERRQRAIGLLTKVGLQDDQQRRLPSHLSGGQQQRVAIARALANQPQLILADEPTGNLDSQTGSMIFDLLHDLAKTDHATIIVVTHDLSIAGKTDVTFELSDGKLSQKK